MARKEIATTIGPALNKTVMALHEMGINARPGARPKDATSMLAKMNGKYSDRTLNTIGDAAGTRLIFDTPEDLVEGRKHIEKLMGMKIIEDEDFLEEGKPGGYRGEHLLLRSTNGVVFEMQLRTQTQHTFAEWAHYVYKGDGPFAGMTPEETTRARAYSEQVGAWIRQKELGEDPGPKPGLPDFVWERMADFPWDLI